MRPVEDDGRLQVVGRVHVDGPLPYGAVVHQGGSLRLRGDGHGTFEVAKHGLLSIEGSVTGCLVLGPRATLHLSGSFSGTLINLGASVAVRAGATLDDRLLGRDGAWLVATPRPYVGEEGDWFSLSASGDLVERVPTP